MLIEYDWKSSTLTETWKKLYQENAYVFPYSSREYNEYIFKYKKSKTHNVAPKRPFLYLLC